MEKAKSMTEKTDNLWRFRYWDKTKYDNLETVQCYHQLAKEEIDRYPAAVDHMRTIHRRSMMDGITKAMYDGWMPLDLEWWEGYVDDTWVLNEYPHVYPGDNIYHFWTRMTLLSRDSVQQDRHAVPFGEFGPAITRYTPPSPR